MKNYIKGNYRRSIFQSDKGFVIGIFKIVDTNDPDLTDFVNKTITFTGYFSDLKEEDTYVLYGEVVDHPKYGFQYQVNEYERVMPEAKDGVIEFLSSELFPGVGIKLATRIVDTLGIDALDKITKEESCLDMVPKMTNATKLKIISTLKEYEGSRQVIVYLTELGFIYKDAIIIYNHYKDRTISVIEANPYNLVDEIDEINFNKIDQIRDKLKISDDDETRIKACIIYNMNRLLFSQGDTYLTYDEIYKSTSEYLNTNIESEIFESYLDTLILEDKIVLDSDRYYTKKMYESEDYVVKKLKKLIDKDPKKISKLDLYIESKEKEYDIKYNEKQKEAIKKALTNNIVVITGGPGTGKTTIIKTIVDLYALINNKELDELTNDLALLAPTGRASKRMSEHTILPASTIHRFLKWNKESNTFMVDEYNKDFSKLIIVDEVSMLDLELMASLLRGLTDNIQLVLVGDYNQLPSVGPGQVLKDLIDSDMIDTVHLDLLYRQSDESYIPILADEIKDNTLDEDFLNKRDDYMFLSCTKESIPMNMKKICNQLVEKGYDYKRVQCMAPMYAGQNGIDNLNKELQEIFNPSESNKIEITVADTIYRENDKILQLVNSPDENVYNGDVGFIEYIIPASKSTSKKNEIYVNYDNNIVKYLPKDFHKIKHGFIISIHKSQGSEFEFVLIPICMSYFRMLYKKLIYTAITRAKQKLVLLGEPEAFVYAVNNNNEYLRKTFLKDKLISTMYK